MSIFNQIGLTLAEKKKRQRRRIVNLGVSTKNLLIKGYEDSFNCVWNPGDGLTTQDVLDEYGTEAIQLFIKSTEAYQYIQSIPKISIEEPDYVPPQVLCIPVFNADGTVSLPPIIRKHPKSISVQSDGRAEFLIEAENASSLKWQKDGVDIVGENNAQLTIENVSNENAGNYTILATNANGQTLSNVAILTVE